MGFLSITPSMSLQSYLFIYSYVAGCLSNPTSMCLVVYPILLASSYPANHRWVSHKVFGTGPSLSACGDKTYFTKHASSSVPPSSPSVDPGNALGVGGLLFSESSLQKGREVQRKSSQPLSALLHKFLITTRANALEVYFHQIGCLSKLIAESEVLNALIYFQNHPLRVLGSLPVLPFFLNMFGSFSCSGFRMIGQVYLLARCREKSDMIPAP